MKKLQIMVRSLTSQSAELQAKIRVIFGLQPGDGCFPGCDETILAFVANPECAEQVLSYLRQETEATLDISGLPLPEMGKREDEDGKPQECSPEEDIAFAESARATLAEEWVQNVFGPQVADVVLTSLNELIERRQKLMMPEETRKQDS